VECLHEQRIAFATAVEQVVAATPETVRAMAELTEALPDVVQCESPGAQPQAAIDRAPVVALLQQAQGRYLMGDAAGTRTVAAEAQARAEAIADARLAAQARGWAALASLRSGDPEPAREQTRAAFDAAVAAGDPSFAAFLALSLATAHGYDARDPEAGRTWIREAETQLERAGRPPRLVARLHSVQAARHQVLGDFTAAREAAALAVQTLEAWDPTSVGLVEARANMGALAQLAGDTRSAAQWLDAARAQAEVQLGPRHPIVGTIASNQMPPLIALGRYREAERRGAEALAILGGADADVVLNLGIALQLQGRAEDARQRYADALRLVEDRHGGNDPRVGQVLVNLADLDARTGRLDEAMAEIERARAVFDAAVPAGHPAHAIVYATESLVHRQRGELARAIERGAAAHAIASAAGDAALRAAVELEYGEALRVADDDRAAAVLDGSVTRAADGDPRLLARLEFALALALGRNHPRAETLVRAALDRYPAEGDPIERQAMQAWVD
jgi:tetratricopeptide (TPR) repeat protein